MNQYIKLFEEWDTPEEWEDPNQDDLDSSGLTDDKTKIENLAKSIQTRLGIKLGEPEWDEFENPEGYSELGAWFQVEDPTKWDPHATESCLVINITREGKFRFVIDRYEIPGPEGSNYDDYSDLYPIDELTPEYWDQVVNWCKENYYLRESWEAPEDWEEPNELDTQASGVRSLIVWFNPPVLSTDDITDRQLLGLTQAQWRDWAFHGDQAGTLISEMYQRSVDYLAHKPDWDQIEEIIDSGSGLDLHFHYQIDPAQRQWTTIAAYISEGVKSEGRVAVGTWLNAQIRMEPVTFRFRGTDQLRVLLQLMDQASARL